MTSADLLTDAFGRIREAVDEVLDGIASGDLTARVDEKANSIAWLIWHLTRVQDDHVAAAAGTEQAWTALGWSKRLALPLEESDIGYGHSSEQVSVVTAERGQLHDYHQVVCESTLTFVRELTDADMDRIVDERWDPPVTLGVRLISVIADNLQHAGQAAFVRGILERRA
jgi:uncharacterized damage-inducible protein DinB